MDSFRSHLAQLVSRPIVAALTLLAVLLAIGGELRAAPPLTAGDDTPGSAGAAGKRTLGGVQFWADELFFRGYRIQRHAVVGHCRLLDAGDRLEAWGSFERCQARLEAIKHERQLQPMSGRAVVLLHGLGGWRGTMQPLADLLARSGEYTVVNIGYASTRADMATHARGLASVLAHLDGITEIDLVAHSLGNLVVRRYLHDAADSAAGRTPDPRLRRMVMLAPPNHGAERAASVSSSQLVSLVLGDSVAELGERWDEVSSTLATPQFDFAIIAGGRGDGNGYSTALSGDDDGMISVSTTQLAGASDFAVLHTRHNLMLVDPRVHELAVRFLDQGFLSSDGRRQPISR